MDQQAFRSLLATPRNGASDEAGESLPAAPPAKRVFGLAKRSREQASSSSKPANLKAKPADAPTEKKWRLPTKNSATGDEYVDRAAARRTGKEGVNEFEEVEQLREEFERRKEGLTEEEKVLVDEQMAFLGGDAKHSVLVKGLDFALLAQQRSRAAEPEAADDDLEAAYAQASTSAQGAKDKEENLTPAEEELKKLERARAAGKFKPIGASKGFAPVTSEEAPEYIWKDGKRMRKKKKKPPVAEPDAAPAVSTPTPTTQDTKSETKPAAPAKDMGPPAPLVPRKLKNVDPKTAVPPHPPAKPRSIEKEKPVPPPAPAVTPSAPSLASAKEEEPEDSDEDIFAGASAWTGIPGGDDSDSDEDADKAPSARPVDAAPPAAAAGAVQPGGRRDWFAVPSAAAVAKQPSGANDESEVDAAEKMIAASLQQQAQAEARAETREAESPTSGRLEGLSSSALPAEMSRQLLEREREREQKAEKRKGGRGEGKDDEEKRKRKRSKKGKGAGSDDD